MSNNENISSNEQQEQNALAVPFFIRYLEGQWEELSEEEMKAVGGGRGLMTKKYPSDSDEGGAITTKLSDAAVTLKYPSDREDGGITGKLSERVVTEKYPSDSDEWAVTQKYPSDGDDDFAYYDLY